MQSTKYLILLAVILLIGNIFFGYKYLENQKIIDQVNKKQQINSNILSFTELFMDKVLNGTKEVSFEDRLQLENSVRELNDKEVYNSWQTFTKAKDSAEVQKDFYALFQLLLKKITL